MIAVNFIKKIGYFTKGLLLNLANRLKPRRTLRWIFSFVSWSIVLLYLGYGVYSGMQIYAKHNDSGAAKFSAKIYPFPAAVIGGRIVWVNDYFKQLSYIQQFSAKVKQPISDPKSLRDQVMNQLVENKILQFQAVKYGIRVTSKDVDDAYQKIVAQAGGTAEVNKVLNELYGMNEKEFKVLVQSLVLKEKIQNELIVQVKVAHIFIKDEGRAKEIFDKAKKGEDFAGLAKQFSEDTKSRDGGGELGWLAKGQLVVDNNSIPEFDEAAFKANKGDITGPVKTGAGFEIIKVEDRKGKIAENFNSWLNGLKKQVKVWRFIQ